eukprot:620079-Pelagomonas_calceolata.AAC.1
MQRATRSAPKIGNMTEHASTFDLAHLFEGRCAGSPTPIEHLVWRQMHGKLSLKFLWASAQEGLWNWTQ